MMRSDQADMAAALCQRCFEDGNWDTMRPSSGPHADQPVWGVAEVESDDQGELRVTWHETGLTLAEAEALIQPGS